MGNSYNFSIGGVYTKALCEIYVDSGATRTALYVAAINKTKGKLKSALASWAQGCAYSFGYSQRYKEHDRKGVMWIKPIYENHTKFYYGEAYNGSILADKKDHPFIITTDDMKKGDFFNYLMNNFSLPLLPEWQDILFEKGIEHGWMNRVSRCVEAVDGFQLCLNGTFVPARSVLVYKIALKEGELESVVSKLLASKQIRISDVENPDVEIDNMDEYMLKYKKHLWQNIEEKINPLVNVRTDDIYVKNAVFKTKRLFEKQQEKVMGCVKSLQNGTRYALLNEGMGVGKTLQSLGVVEEFFNSKFLKRHPDKELKDCYEDGAVTYRNIVISPAHLVQKWSDEIKKEVPGARTVILNDLSQLIALREHGPEREGKEFYLIGKDFCKLGVQYAPVPTKLKRRKFSIPVCKTCYHSGNKYVPDIRPKNRSGKCEKCGGTEFMAYPQNDYERGLVCPECGELLIRPMSSYSPGMPGDDRKKALLTTAEFANKSADNNACFHCGCQLWTANVKNLDCNGTLSKRKKKWYKITHFANAAQKSTTTAWVLRGCEHRYLLDHKLSQNVPLEQGGFDLANAEHGPRRVAPAVYIKKYLKGYFDFCILDEVHKFEGEGTAQSNAAQALVKASKYALGLTGTIANGSAVCLYSLLWLLEPQRMKNKGYNRDSESLMAFAKEYGTVETVYETSKWGGEHNKNSRGKQIQAPRVKPGISPRLFLDFLIDRAVFMDISDMGKELPPLTEYIELVDLPFDVWGHYNTLMGTLKSCLRSKEGASARSNILQMGLSYPDKPYGRAPIKSTVLKDNILAYPFDNKKYADASVLLPKEQRLVELVNTEQAEGRNVFIYCSYTGAGEANVMYRLQEIIEKNCNLTGRVCVVNSTSPSATKREEYIHKKAAAGMKVFLINPKCCETGLDFCFSYEGKDYNYPTLVFYQITYELAVLWQASRRHYRACQTKECRTYWLAYRGTLQAAALEIMANKQVAVSAVQGKFSSEGLASMASGVNAQEKLAQALLQEREVSDDTLSGLFDKINAANRYTDEDDDGFVFKEALLYSEVTGVVESTDISDDDLFGLFDFSETFSTPMVAKVEDTANEEEDLFDFLFGEGGGVMPSVDFGNTTVSTETVSASKKKKKLDMSSVSYSLFDF